MESWGDGFFPPLGMKRKAFSFVFLSFLIFIPFISHSNAQTCTVKRVIDGDTLLLTNGEKVRLIGIDAPESKPNPRAEKQVEVEGKWREGTREGT